MMKTFPRSIKTTSLVALLFTAWLTTVPADLSNEIAGYIRTGNSKDLARYFDTNVTITIEGKESSYSKTQAEQVVRDFFVKNPPRTFEVVHKGTSRDGKQYVIGTLVTTNKITFRAMYVMRQKEGNFFIQELKFEKQ